jgi:hypothetical protein
LVDIERRPSKNLRGGKNCTKDRLNDVQFFNAMLKMAEAVEALEFQASVFFLMQLDEIFTHMEMGKHGWSSPRS